mmetsp:Transcript_92842/g.165071  ORF Transcript_92842/g.165071 Transcript_92842/m.165071 type:complete len:207 (-) Transcript_92842:541-1161(-)
MGVSARLRQPSNSGCSRASWLTSPKPSSRLQDSNSQAIASQLRARKSRLSPQSPSRKASSSLGSDSKSPGFLRSRKQRQCASAGLRVSGPSRHSLLSSPARMQMSSSSTDPSNFAQRTQAWCAAKACCWTSSRPLVSVTCNSPSMLDPHCATTCSLRLNTLSAVCSKSIASRASHSLLSSKSTVKAGLVSTSKREDMAVRRLPKAV